MSGVEHQKLAEIQANNARPYRARLLNDIAGRCVRVPATQAGASGAEGIVGVGTPRETRALQGRSTIKRRRIGLHQGSPDQ